MLLAGLTIAAISQWPVALSKKEKLIEYTHVILCLTLEQRYRLICYICSISLPKKVKYNFPLVDCTHIHIFLTSYKIRVLTPP